MADADADAILFFVTLVHTCVSMLRVHTAYVGVLLYTAYVCTQHMFRVHTAYMYTYACIRVYLIGVHTVCRVAQKEPPPELKPPEKNPCLFLERGFPSLICSTAYC